MKKNEVVYDALEEYNPFSVKDKSQEPAVINVTNNNENNEINKYPLLINSKEGNNFQGDRETKNEKESSKLIEGPIANWPPLPKFCPIQPCFYLNFDVDIPENYRGLIKFAYYLWIAYLTVMIFNILGSLAYYITANSMISGSTFGTSIVFGILFPILSFFFWFWPLYKAIRWDSSTNYFIFFIVICAQIVVTGIQMLGIDWLGSCGFINALIMFRKDVVTGCIMFFIGLWFCTLFALFILLLFKVNYIYRHSSVSDVRNARAELTKNITNTVIRSENNTN